MTQETPHDYLADSAMEYAELGFLIVPLYGLVSKTGNDGTHFLECTCQKGTTCKSAGKHPRIMGWQKYASSNIETVRSWWWKYPGSNIGWAMGGPARLVALDVDGELGRSSLQALQEKHGQLVRTLTARSGREDGGEHRIFKVPAQFDIDLIKNNAGKLAPGLDVRSQDGQIVVAPSMHSSGRPYVWVDDGVISELPQWLYEAFVARKPRKTTTTSGSTTKTVSKDDKNSSSFSELRHYLVNRRRSLDPTDDRFAIFTKIINEEALAQPNSRSITINQALTYVAWAVPSETAVESAIELVRPSIAAMDYEPEGLNHWLGVATESYQRAMWRRGLENEKLNSWNEALKARRRAQRAEAGLQAVADSDVPERLVVNEALKTADVLIDRADTSGDHLVDYSDAPPDVLVDTP